MIYTKIKTDNKFIEVPVDELDFFCKCPVCGKETTVPIFEFMENGDFDIYCDVYCDKCSNETGIYRKKLSEIQVDYNLMPLDKLTKIFKLIAPYFDK